MQSKADTVDQYLASLPDDRRAAIETVRGVFLDNLDKQYEEGMSYGMIGYAVPHSVYPPGYHCNPKQPLPFGGLASQKGHMSLYLMCLYGDPTFEAWFRAEWAKTGKKLDMGKACIRFKKLEDLALDVLAEAIRRVPARTYIERYESLLGRSGRGQTGEKETASGNSAGKSSRAPTSSKSRPRSSSPAKSSASGTSSAKASPKRSAKKARPAKSAAKAGGTKNRKKTSKAGPRSPAARSAAKSTARSRPRRRARA